MGRFQVLHSSAGAGKTHALVKQYLRLALAGPDPSSYKHILALTFTNKAAGEMRERIVQYLEKLVGDPGEDKAVLDVRDTLLAEVGIPIEELQSRAQRTLKHMLHHWPQLAVSTIDAFTRRVVMPFARDLRLDSELRMTTEEELYRDLAVELLLEEAGNDPALTELLVATCEQLLEEERDWRADKPLRSLSKQLTKEQALEHLKELRGLGNAHFIALQARLRERTNAFRERLRSLGKSALDTLEAEGIGEADLAYGKAGPISYLRQLARFTDLLEEKKNTLKVMASGKWCSTSADASVRAAVDRIAPMLKRTIEEGEELRTNGELRAHVVRSAVLRNLLPAATLHLIDERLEHIKHTEGVSFFSDLVRKVADIVMTEPAPFLFERLGEKYQHFLIDEFQDTSLLQWHSLLPLIENALSSDGTAFLVGDAKQAIYRWRNGEVRQFVELPRLFGKERMNSGEEREQVLVRTFEKAPSLVENRRSGRAIIQFNNDLFGALKTLIPPELSAVYDEHAQEIRSSDPGYVQVNMLLPQDDEEETTTTTEGPFAEHVIACIANATEAGFAPGDIAVLVRSNKLGRVVADRLARAGFDVVSPDGLTLGSDAGNRAVMAVFAWLQRKDDPSAMLAVQEMMRLKPGENAFDLSGDPRAQLRAWAAAHRAIHQRGGLLSSIHHIVQALEIDPARDAFSMGLLNEVHHFTLEKGEDAQGFLEHWERIRDARSVSSSDGGNAVSVMTVHKSKGLQFPVVIVPNADMNSRASAGEMIWVDPRPSVEELPTALVRKGKALTQLELPEITEENGALLVDELDLLYVACTRPEKRLYLGIPPKGNSAVLTLLRDFLQLGPGDQDTYGQPNTPAQKKKRTADVRELLPPPSKEPLAPVVRSTAPIDWDAADPDPFRAHGRLMHAVLERIRVAEDLDRALAEEGDTATLPAEALKKLREQLRVLLALPAVQPFFAPGLEVRSEVTIIDAEGHAHRPDRVVRDANGTRVLDLKTGVPDLKHHVQVHDYMKLLRQLGEEHVTGHLLYVHSREVVEVT